MDKEPKDFRLARRAYEAYHHEQPQVWFKDLSHEYQMRWVTAVREVLKEVPRLKSPVSMATTAARINLGRGKDKVKRIRSVAEAEVALKGIPILPNGRRDYSRLYPPAKRIAQNAIKYLREHGDK